MTVTEARKIASDGTPTAEAVAVLVEALDAVESDCRTATAQWPAWYLRDKIFARIGVEQ